MTCTVACSAFGHACLLQPYALCWNHARLEYVKPRHNVPSAFKDIRCHHLVCDARDGVGQLPGGQTIQRASVDRPGVVLLQQS